MSDNLTQVLWNSISGKISTIPALPEWLEKIVSLSLLELKELNNDIVTVEMDKVSDSYLAFLRKQIELNARGTEWTDILRRRLRAIEPYKDKDLIHISISGERNQFYMRLTPQPEMNIVHWEIL